MRSRDASQGADGCIPVAFSLYNTIVHKSMKCILFVMKSEARNERLKSKCLKRRDGGGGGGECDIRQ